MKNLTSEIKERRLLFAEGNPEVGSEDMSNKEVQAEKTDEQKKTESLSEIKNFSDALNTVKNDVEGDETYPKLNTLLNSKKYSDIMKKAEKADKLSKKKLEKLLEDLNGLVEEANAEITKDIEAKPKLSMREEREKVDRELPEYEAALNELINFSSELSSETQELLPKGVTMKTMGDNTMADIVWNTAIDSIPSIKGTSIRRAQQMPTSFARDISLVKFQNRVKQVKNTLNTKEFKENHAKRLIQDKIEQNMAILYPDYSNNSFPTEELKQEYEDLVKANANSSSYKETMEIYDKHFKLIKTVTDLQAEQKENGIEDDNPYRIDAGLDKNSDYNKYGSLLKRLLVINEDMIANIEKELPNGQKLSEYDLEHLEMDIIKWSRIPSAGTLGGMLQNPISLNDRTSPESFLKKVQAFEKDKNLQKQLETKYINKYNK